MLWLAKVAARTGRGSQVVFDVRRVPRDGYSVHSYSMRMRFVIGPGDDGGPVFTVRVLEED